MVQPASKRLISLDRQPVRNWACRVQSRTDDCADWVTGEGGSVTMAQLLDRDALQPQARGEREKAIKILAKSIYRQMRETGYDTREIVALSSEIIGLITTDIKPDTSK
jgi:hypothetical protein